MERLDFADAWEPGTRDIDEAIRKQDAPTMPPPPMEPTDAAAS